MIDNNVVEHIFNEGTGVCGDGRGRTPYYIHTCARRERREETKREGRKKKRTAFTSRQKIQELHTKKLVGLRKMICHHVHAIRQDDEYGAYG